MSKQTQGERQQHGDMEQSVADYLHDHHDFFERHLDLLEELKIPHPSGSAASLIERQVRRLQEENRRIKGKLMQMVDNARDNDRITERMHGLALALLAADGVDEVAITVDDIFRNGFGADAVALRLLDPGGGGVEGINTPLLSADEFAPLRPYLDKRRPDCERLSAKLLERLFGDDAVRIASTVVLPLAATRDYGLLVVGSEDERRFQPGMGTHYLERMADLVSHALSRHIG